MSLLNINEIYIGGRLGKDPESFANGKVVTVSIANNRRYKNPKKGGAWDSETSWVTIKGFGYMCEKLLAFQKGDQVFVRGALKEETFETQGGRTQSKLVVVVSGISGMHMPKAEGVQQEEVEGFPDEVYPASGGDSDVPF